MIHLCINCDTHDNEVVVLKPLPLQHLLIIVKIKGMYDKMAKIFNWKKPILTQWPLMVTYMLLIGWTSLTSNPIPRWMLIFLHAYLVASIVTLLKSKTVKFLIYIAIYLLFFIEIVLEELYGMSISPNVLVLVVETNARESKEFMGSMLLEPSLWRIPIYLIFALTITLYLENNRQRFNNFIKGTKIAKFFVSSAAVLLLGGCAFSYCYYQLFRCTEMNEVDEWYSHMSNPDDIVTKLILSLYDVKLGNKEMEKTIETAEHVKTSQQIMSQDSIKVVLVIGESFIREHASIYGYALNTTPFLLEEERKGRLFVFNNMISPFNQTTGVIRNLISCNSIGDGEYWSSKPPLTAVFKKSGYHVSMYDNQKDYGLNALFSYSLNTYLYHPRMVEACYNVLNDSTFEYDGQLIDYYSRMSSNNYSKQLILFHLLGQHLGCEYRYPKEFSYFTIDSTSFRRELWLTDRMRQEIVHYDNATRYNDFVLKKIIGHFFNDNCVVVYLSDHGEEVYDYRDNLGRDDWSVGDDPKQTIRWQYMVPFVVWCSDKYKENYPDIVAQLESSTARPAMLDNVCQILFHLSGLKTPYYKDSRNLLSPDYHCPKRIINGTINGDSIMNSNN